MTNEQYLGICKLAVKNNGSALKYVKANKIEPEQYYEICKIALQHLVNISNSNEEIYKTCLVAVQIDSTLLYYVNELKSKITDDQYFEICKKAITSSYWNAFDIVIADNMTPEQYYEICKLAVTKYGTVLQYVNVIANKMTVEQYYKICKLAVKTNGIALQYVITDNININMTDYQKKKICKLALQNLENLSNSNEDIYETSLVAVKINGNLILSTDGSSNYVKCGGIMSNQNGTLTNFTSVANSTGLCFVDNGSLALISNSSERMRIDNSGNVGINTTTPIYNLQIGDNTNSNKIIATTNIHLTNNYFDSGAWGVRIAGFDNNSNGHDFKVLTRNAPYASFVESFTVTSSGNVGIGITNSNCRLYISSNLATSATVYAMRLSCGASTDGGGFGTLLGLGSEPNGWSKCAIGHTRTGPYDQGDIVFLTRATVDNAVVK
jgi:hypothetical protein